MHSATQEKKEKVVVQLFIRHYTRLSDIDPQVRLASVHESVSILGNDAVPHLADRLEDYVIQVCLVAAEQLVSIGNQQAAEALIHAASNADPIIAANGAYGLHFWQSKDGLSVLLAALSNSDAGCRGAAAMAVARIGAGEIVAGLAKAFARAGDDAEKTDIAAALALLGEEFYSSISNPELPYPWPAVMLVALTTIGLINNGKAVFAVGTPLEVRNNNISAYTQSVLETLGLLDNGPHHDLREELTKFEIRSVLPEGYQLEALV